MSTRLSAIRSSSILASSSGDSVSAGGGGGDPTEDPFYRLHHAPKSNHKPKVEDSNQALVSELPTHTLKWMKKRRSLDTEKKVVLSHHAERQLREMFNSLDINHSGTISLAELTEAVEYVQEKTKGAKGLEAFQNIASVFAAMDDNGDGTIDFMEFTNGMTGTSNSAFEKASPYDIEKLFSFFVEFGERKQREHAVRKINEAMGLGSSPSPTSLPKGVSEPPSPHGKSAQQSFSADVPFYQSFKALFGNEDSSAKTKTEQRRQSADIAAKKAKQIESLLAEFLSAPIVGGDPMDALGKEKANTENKLKDLRKQQIDMHYNDPDMLAHVQRSTEKRRSEVARRSQLLPSINEGQHPMRHGSSLLVKDEQSLRINAQKDAYDTLRNGLTAEENSNLMATAQAMMRSHQKMQQQQPEKSPNRLTALRGSQQVSSLRASYSSPSISLSPTKASYTGGQQAAHSPRVSAKNSTKSPGKAAQMSRSSLYFAEGV